MNDLHCIYRPPFSQVAPRIQKLPAGRTLAEMVPLMHLPSVFHHHGTICVGGHPVPRGAWHLVRPKAVTGGFANVVTFHAPIMGGGEDGGKNPLALIAAIGLTVLSGGAAAGLFGAGGSLAVTGSSTLFAAGSISANFLAGGISLIGSLLINALVPPPTLDGGEAQDQTRRDASARGNVIAPNGVVPRVIGQRRMFPPLLSEPLVTFDGDDEVVEAVYGLSGPHQLDDIQIGAAPVSTISGLTFETREGFPGDRRISLLQRYGRTEGVGQEIRGHRVSQTDAAALALDTDVSQAVPQPQVIATRRAPDVHELQLAFSQGLGRPGAPNALQRVPIRIRIRPRGAEAWRNLPEIHYQGADFRQLRATIRLAWRAAEVVAPTAGSAKGFVAAFTETQPQTIAPPSPAWEADAYFYAGSGDAYLNQNNLGSTGIVNLSLSRGTAEFVLDPAEFSPGIYEVEIKRGAAFDAASFTDSTYVYGATVYDFFAYFGTPGRIPAPRSDLSDTLGLIRSVSIWRRAPVTTDAFALIAIRARNQNIERLSVNAGGLVRDWDDGAEDWTDWKVTSNPAPHYRDVLVGAQNADPLPMGNLDDDGLLEWRDACTDAGHTCDVVLNDTSVGEALSVIAACGYARTYQSDRWGVIRDYDRSAEPPVQLFTPRNTAGFSWSKAFKSLPDGLRVTFDDASQDYEARQISVFRRGITIDTGLMEQVRYEGVTTEAAAIARAEYDMAQLEKRATFFSFDTGFDALSCRRGSLVGVVNDAVARNVGYGRVLEGYPGGVVLDADIPCSNEPDVYAVTDMYAVADIWALGERTEAQIRYPDGDVVSVPLSNATGETDTLQFAETIDRVPEGALIATRVLVSEYRRMIVFDMNFKGDNAASMRLVDEAPEIFA